MISANGGLPAHRYTPQVTQRWPRGSEPASQHSCGTLESRIKIFGCMVQELYITFYPLGHYPLLHQVYVHIKGV